MKLEGEQKLLRIFVEEQDQWHGLPLHEAIVKEALSLGMAGATVIKGFLGFGRKAHLHTTKLLELSEDLPIVIEIVDSAAQIQKLLPRLDEMVREGLVTLEDVHVVIYRTHGDHP